MQLRSGEPFWPAIHPPLTSYPSLLSGTKCEVVLLGGGITGSLIAYHLVKKGVDVVLIDKRQPGVGSTAASTGLLQYEIDTPLCELIKKVGEANAVHAYRRGLRAIDEIELLISELNDACGFSRRESLYFASHFWHQRYLKREYECRRQHGFDVRFVHRDELKNMTSIPSSGAIISRGDAQIDPYRFSHLLLDASVAAGLRAFADTPVRDVIEHADSVAVVTDQGTVTAKQIVYATGYESADFLDHKVGTLHSTYAVVSQPLSTTAGWPNGCLIWETARPYFYARQTQDGRAMIGGEDTLFSKDHQRERLVDRKIRKLLNRFKKLFPAIPFEPACDWAGTFGETNDGLAYIGQPVGRPRAYFALGYGGNGITFSVIAARLICDLYLGNPNDDEAVFAFGR